MAIDHDALAKASRRLDALRKEMETLRAAKHLSPAQRRAALDATIAEMHELYHFWQELIKQSGESTDTTPDASQTAIQ